MFFNPSFSYNSTQKFHPVVVQ